MTNLGDSYGIELYLDAKCEGDKHNVSKNEHESKLLSNDVPPVDFIACPFYTMVLAI